METIMDEITLFDHVSDWSFEQIAEWYKKWNEPSNPGLALYPNMQILTDMYHWCEGDQSLSIETLMNDKPLYVCDYSSAWNVTKRGNMTLYKVTCVLRHPLCLLEQGIYLEQMMDDLMPRLLHRQKETSKVIDAIAYTPHPYMDEPELRQMCLLFPQESIKSIVLIGKHP